MMCISGLSMEGVCQNPDCKAYKERVIMNPYHHVFDMKADLKQCRCPMCKMVVHPDACAFNNTFYSFAGILPDEKGSGKIKVMDQEEIRVGDEYLRLTPDKSGWAKWKYLKIFTRRLKLNQQGNQP